MARLRERLEPHFLTLIICGGSGLAAGFPLFYVARAWGSPGLLIFPVIGLAVMLVGFAVAPNEPSEPAEAGPYDGQIMGLSEAEFDRLEDEVERSARAPLPPPEPMDDAAKEAFAQLVRDAIDELPDFVQKDLSEGNLAILVSDGGDDWKALGLYMGGHVRNPTWDRRILMFRDTLTRAYGRDPDELRRQVAITLRHEVAHFYGADEQKVRALGL